jgi:hypothetical protein
VLCDNFNYKYKHETAGFSNSTWGKKTQLLKELTNVMRSGDSCIFFFGVKSKTMIPGIEMSMRKSPKNERGSHLVSLLYSQLQ